MKMIRDFLGSLLLFPPIWHLPPGWMSEWVASDSTGLSELGGRGGILIYPITLTQLENGGSRLCPPIWHLLPGWMSEWVNCVWLHRAVGTAGIRGTMPHPIFWQINWPYLGGRKCPPDLKTFLRPDPSLTPSDNTCVEHHHLYMLLQCSLRQDI